MDDVVQPGVPPRRLVLLPGRPRRPRASPKPFAEPGAGQPLLPSSQVRFTVAHAQVRPRP